jgi:hypothetical protein
VLRKSGELFQSSLKLDDIDVQGCDNPGLELANAFGVSSSQQLATTGFPDFMCKAVATYQLLSDSISNHLDTPSSSSVSLHLSHAQLDARLSLEDIHSRILRLSEQVLTVCEFHETNVPRWREAFTLYTANQV